MSGEGASQISSSSVNRIQVWVHFDPSHLASESGGVQSLTGRLSMYMRNKGLRVAGRDDLDAMMASNLILPRVSPSFCTRNRDQIKTTNPTNRQQQRNNTCTHNHQPRLPSSSRQHRMFNLHIPQTVYSYQASKAPTKSTLSSERGRPFLSAAEGILLRPGHRPSRPKDLCHRGFIYPGSGARHIESPLSTS